MKHRISMSGCVARWSGTYWALHYCDGEYLTPMTNWLAPCIYCTRAEARAAAKVAREKGHLVTPVRIKLTVEVQDA